MSSGTTTGVDPLALFAAAAERVVAATAFSDLDAPVPACAGWTAYDLVVHLGNVHAWAATIVETGEPAVTQNDEPSGRKPRTVSAWYSGKAEDLYQVLRATDPARPCWNFAFGAGEAGFWHRRQLHETTIHGLDLDASAGRSTSVAADVATDGVDEVLTVMLKRMHDRGHPAALTAPLSLVCEDTGRAWTVTPRRAVGEPAVPPQPRGPEAGRPHEASVRTDGPPLVADRRHPQADLVSAPASLLYQALWKRLPSDGLTMTGDEDRIRAFLDSRLVP